MSLGDTPNRLHNVRMKVLLAVVMVFAGVMHFAAPGAYVRVMPAYLPFPHALVLASGALEVLLGGLLLLPATSRLAAWGLMALFVAVFPANLNMALNPQLTPGIPAWLLWARLPLQAVLILWAHRYT